MHPFIKQLLARNLIEESDDGYAWISLSVSLHFDINGERYPVDTLIEYEDGSLVMYSDDLWLDIKHGFRFYDNATMNVIPDFIDGMDEFITR